jgi:hypothetical protein
MEASKLTHGMQSMKIYSRATNPAQQEGKAGYILLWLLGIPIPILLLIFLLRGCN